MSAGGENDFRTYRDLIRSKGWWCRFRWQVAMAVSRFGWWVTPEPMRSQMQTISKARFGEFKQACDRLLVEGKGKP